MTPVYLRAYVESVGNVTEAGKPGVVLKIDTLGHVVIPLDPVQTARLGAHVYRGVVVSITAEEGVS